jgi:hypothetical protein
MKIMQRHTAMVIPSLGTIIATMSPPKGLRSSWPKTGDPIPSQVQGNAKALQSAAWSAYRRDIADRKFMAELDAILASLPE